MNFLSSTFCNRAVSPVISPIAFVTRRFASAVVSSKSTFFGPRQFGRGSTRPSDAVMYHSSALFGVEVGALGQSASFAFGIHPLARE